jgi:hypothetical protein
MHSLLANGLWTLPASHFFPYGFLVLAVALVSFMVSDLRRAARESAAKKSEAAQFVARYREPNGMSIFFAPEEDPSTAAVQPAYARKRRTDK